MNKSDHSAINPAFQQMLALQLSYRCPAACRSCAFDCGPGHGRVMALVDARRIIDSAKEIPLIKNFGFTGGEPFLHLDMLRELFRHVKHNFGDQMTISTNCFWAITKEKAARILDEFVALGLSSLLVSIDDFHLEYIKISHIENCINAAIELGVKCILQCLETRSSRKLADFKDKLNIPSDSPLIEWHAYPCDPVGRAASEVAHDELLLNWRNQPGRCNILKLWMVDPDGRVSGCCSWAMSEFLRVGNALEEPLPDIINRANVDPILNCLSAFGGPYLLINLLQASQYSHYASDTYTSPCHACYRIFQDRSDIWLIQKQIQEQWLELVASRLIAHKQIYELNQANRQEDFWLPVPW